MWRPNAVRRRSAFRTVSRTQESAESSANTAASVVQSLSAPSIAPGLSLTLADSGRFKRKREVGRARFVSRSQLPACRQSDLQTRPSRVTSSPRVLEWRADRSCRYRRYTSTSRPPALSRSRPVCRYHGPVVRLSGLGSRASRFRKGIRVPPDFATSTLETFQTRLCWDQAGRPRIPLSTSDLWLSAHSEGAELRHRHRTRKSLRDHFSRPWRTIAHREPGSPTHRPNGFTRRRRGARRGHESGRNQDK